MDIMRRQKRYCLIIDVFLDEVAKALVEKKTLRAKDIKEIKQQLNMC